MSAMPKEASVTSADDRAVALCKKLGMTRYPEDCEVIAAELRSVQQEERAYWQEFMKLNNFEDRSEAFKAGMSRAAEMEPHDCPDPYACHCGEYAERIRKEAGEL